MVYKPLPAVCSSDSRIRASGRMPMQSKELLDHAALAPSDHARKQAAYFHDHAVVASPLTAKNSTQHNNQMIPYPIRKNTYTSSTGPAVRSQ
jgi:hypothetical protein